MAFTMHSHSGQFCPGHAKDQLEAILERAIFLGYTHIGLTEHMPRILPQDLYPEELEAERPSDGSPLPPIEDTCSLALSRLHPRHQDYLAEALRLRQQYADKIHILIAFEADFIRPTDYTQLVQELASDPRVDYFIGSLHHVKQIPIDFDHDLYDKAVAACVTSDAIHPDAALASAYYDEHLVMLENLKPRIVGHFDLHRLLSADPDLSSEPDYPPPGDSEAGTAGWSAVHQKALRNLRFVASYGGILECNTAALRKGLSEPYPARPIAKAWLDMGGKFTLSDDSHGIAQLGTNYAKGVRYLESLGVGDVWVLEREGDGKGIVERSVALGEIKRVIATWGKLN